MKSKTIVSFLFGSLLENKLLALRYDKDTIANEIIATAEQQEKEQKQEIAFEFSNFLIDSQFFRYYDAEGKTYWIQKNLNDTIYNDQQLFEFFLKEKQKKLLVEIMDHDAKNGLYDTNTEKITDEEIDKQSWIYDPRNKFDAAFIREAFIRGAEWCREKSKPKL